MRPVLHDEIRFLLKFRLQKLPASILRDLNGAVDKREKALAMAVDILAEPFKRLSIEAPDPPIAPFMSEKREDG
jgi:hypothetical protein